MWKWIGWISLTAWKDYGWSEGTLTYSQTVTGGGIGVDTSHLAMSSIVVYTSCYKCRIQVSWIQSSPIELYWTWNAKKRSWENGYRP